MISFRQKPPPLAGTFTRWFGRAPTSNASCHDTTSKCPIIPDA
jgi:hypothetical protein